MGILCFGSYSTYLKKATLLTNEGIITLLFKALVPSFSSSSINEGDKSRLIGAKYEVPTYIKSPASGIPSASDIEEYFRISVVPTIIEAKQNLFLDLLKALIRGDSNIPAADKQLFTSKETQLSAYLSTVFLYAVQQPNKFKVSPLPDPVTSDSVITIDGVRIYLNGVEIKIPDKLTPPEKYASHEAVYIAELLRAYAEADGVQDVNPDAIPQKYQKNFREQRQHYINAEAVRRRTREVFSATNDPFIELKENVYNGVSPVHSQNWQHGYERLLKVLQQAASLPDGVSLLEKQLGWVRASQKMGVCHILINDRRIESWVVPNE